MRAQAGAIRGRSGPVGRRVMPLGRGRLLRAIVVSTAVAAAAGGPARAEDPAQWWNAFQSNWKAGGGTVEGKAEWRVAEGGDVFFWSAEASWMRRGGTRWSWGPGVKYQEVRQPGGPFLGERRILLTGRVGLGETAGWRPSLRFLFERRDREEQPLSWRGRLRGDARRRLGGSPWDLGVTNEVFFDSADDRYAQNRLQITLGRRLGESTGFSVYYLLRSDRRGRHWEETQVLGTVWSFG